MGSHLALTNNPRIPLLGDDLNAKDNMGFIQMKRAAMCIAARNLVGCGLFSGRKCCGAVLREMFARKHQNQGDHCELQAKGQCAEHPIGCAKFCDHACGDQTFVDLKMTQDRHCNAGANKGV